MASRDIKDCVTELKQRWPLLKNAFENKFPGWQMILTCTYRTPEEQYKTWLEGRIYNAEKNTWDISDWRFVKTMRDGVKRLSLHNYYPAKAFDFALLNEKGTTVWIDPVQAMPTQWGCIPDLAKSVDLESGGNWTKLHDWCHIQLPIKI